MGLFTGVGGAAASTPHSAAAGSIPAAIGGDDWGKAIPVPGLAKLNSGNSAETISISCPSAGNCSAGGVYTNAQGDQPWVDSEKNGTWGTARQVPGIAAINRGQPQYANGELTKVTSVSCAATGDCSAVGTYFDANDNEQVFVVNEKGGVWGKAEEIPGMAKLNTGGNADVYQVSCGAVGNCSAVGYYYGAEGLAGEHAFVASERNGTWRAEEVPGITPLEGGDLSVLNSVSCTAAGTCSAGGDSGNGTGFTVDEVKGTWAKARAVTKPPAPGGILQVSCWGAGDCVAAATYYYEPYIISEKGGSWGAPEAITGPNGFNAGDPSIVALSCGGSGDCAVVGVDAGYVDSKWADAVTGGAPATPDIINPVNWGSLSCSRTGVCGAGGWADASTGSPAEVASVTGGAFGAPEQVPAAAGFSTKHADAMSVSCAAGGCAAAGSYSEGSTNGAFVTGAGKTTTTCSSSAEVQGAGLGAASGFGAAAAQCKACPTPPSAFGAATPAQPHQVVLPWGNYWYAGAREEEATDGAQGTFLVAQPKLTDCHSLAEMAVYAKQNTYQIEVGWTVDPQDYSEGHPDLPHLFVYHWVEADTPTGYSGPKNEYGFKVESKKIYPGMPLAKGEKLTLKVQRVDDQWRVYADGTLVGYFPLDLWKAGTFDKATNVAWFGEVAASKATTKPCSQMGTGHVPVPGFDVAAEIDSLDIYNSKGKLEPAAIQTYTAPEKDKYYEVSRFEHNDKDNNIEFGGPGACG